MIRWPLLALLRTRQCGVRLRWRGRAMMSPCFTSQLHLLLGCMQSRAIVFTEATQCFVDCCMIFFLLGTVALVSRDRLSCLSFGAHKRTRYFWKPRLPIILLRCMTSLIYFAERNPSLQKEMMGIQWSEIAKFLPGR